jgi:hypothetical protein
MQMATRDAPLRNVFKYNTDDSCTLGWPRLRLVNSCICILRECVEAILAHTAERIQCIDGACLSAVRRTRWPRHVTSAHFDGCVNESDAARSERAGGQQQQQRGATTPHAVFVWDDSMAQVIGVDMVCCMRWPGICWILQG